MELTVASASLAEGFDELAIFDGADSMNSMATITSDVIQPLRISPKRGVVRLELSSSLSNSIAAFTVTTQPLPASCPLNCQMHGHCNGSTCICSHGYIGPSCSAEVAVLAKTAEDMCSEGGAAAGLTISTPATGMVGVWSEWGLPTAATTAILTSMEPALAVAVGGEAVKVWRADGAEMREQLGRRSFELQLAATAGAEALAFGLPFAYDSNNSIQVTLAGNMTVHGVLTPGSTRTLDVSYRCSQLPSGSRSGSNRPVTIVVPLLNACPVVFGWWKHCA